MIYAACAAAFSLKMRLVWTIIPEADCTEWLSQMG